MRFIDRLNLYLKEVNAQPIESIAYEQYAIRCESNKFFVYEKDRLLIESKSLQKAKEYINSIVSGC